jgi:hypothetical protein
LQGLPKDQLYFIEIGLSRGVVDPAAVEVAITRALTEDISVVDALTDAGAVPLDEKAQILEEIAGLAFTCSQCGNSDIHRPGTSTRTGVCDACFSPSAPTLAGVSDEPEAPPPPPPPPAHVERRFGASRPEPATYSEERPPPTRVSEDAAPPPTRVSDRTSVDMGDSSSSGGPPTLAPAKAGEGIEAGQILGGCRILAKIGQGGMGRVYRARHLGFDREVALKVLEDRLVARQGFIDQFMAEARILFGLDHPNIVRVFNVDKDQSGVCLLVMELLDGGSVHNLWVKSGKQLPVDEAVRIVSEAAQGLHYAHLKKLLHRDVKPANLMLSAEGRVKIVDFGLAVPTENELFVATSVAGTPLYMAPEQADGLKLDPRCDQYALGVSLFQLVCGRFPFEKPKPIEVLFAHMQEAPPRPRELRPDLPEWLERIILKMLAKAPRDRFASLQQVVEALAKGIGEEAPAVEEAPAPAPPVEIRPKLRLEQVVAFEKGLAPEPVALPGWRSAIAVAAASLVAAALFLLFPAREALGRNADLGRDEVPAAVHDIEKDVQAQVASGKGVDLAAALARVTDAAQDLGARPGAGRLDALRESVKQLWADAASKGRDALAKRSSDLVAKKHFGAALESLVLNADEIALELEPTAADLRAKIAKSLLDERGEVCIPKGPYVGENGEPVTLPGFYMDRTEVTNAAWAAAGLPAPASWPQGKLDPALAQRPVTGVSFEEADRYARASGKRLPTSSEWAKAARGGSDDRAYPWGPRFDPGKANVLDGGAGSLEDVATCEGDVSPFGVRDLAGNALEWVSGPSGPLAAGGGYLSHSASARVFARLALDPKTRHAAIGFRCARDLERD